MLLLLSNAVVAGERAGCHDSEPGGQQPVAATQKSVCWEISHSTSSLRCARAGCRAGCRAVCRAAPGQGAGQGAECARAVPGQGAGQGAECARAVPGQGAGQGARCEVHLWTEIDTLRKVVSMIAVQEV
jgi:hypothetical protein